MTKTWLFPIETERNTARAPGRGGWRFAAGAALALALCPAASEARPMRLLVLGDSLSAAYRLPAQAAFPSALARRLHAAGHGDVEVLNGAEPGDKTGDAAKRVPALLDQRPDVVIVELGANDMLGEMDTRIVHHNLNWIISNFRAHGARVVLAGMVAEPKLDPAYRASFDAIYPALAAQHGLSLYPFFLQGVLGNRALTQSDGKHPNALGVERIAAGIFPIVHKNLAAARASERRPASASRAVFGLEF